MRRDHRIPLILLTLFLLPDGKSGYAQRPSFDLKRRIANPAPDAGSRFGHAVAVTSHGVLVGAPLADGAAADAGAAYLFDGATGALRHTFRSPNPGAGDQFGAAVAAAGQHVLIGAPGEDTGAPDAGAVYLFDGATGELRRTFRKVSPGEGDAFGSAVSAAGASVLVGAPLDDRDGADAGAAYLFDGATGALLTLFRNPTPDRGDRFGSALAVNGSRVLVGAAGDDASGNDAGAVHLFDSATGSLVRTQPHPHSKPGDEFGTALAVIGSDFLAGTPLFDDAGARDSGWVFEVKGVTGESRYGYPNQSHFAGAHFGRSVATIADLIFVGSPGSVELHRGGGVVFFPRAMGWEQYLRNPAPSEADEFGFALATGTDLLVVGAPGDE